MGASKIFLVAAILLINLVGTMISGGGRCLQTQFCKIINDDLFANAITHQTTLFFRPAHSVAYLLFVSK